tara:strand:- start:1015 stop:1386 length:372 start_codon:yes stop_codon:yes gene_type:complete
MAISQDTAYGFGQLGSVYTTNGQSAISPPTGKVFVAITMLADTVFDASGGLVADTTNTAIAGLEYVGTEVAAHNLSDGSETAISGSEGLVVDSVTFPKGVTIYGRWTEIDVSSGGGVIAYIGE